jgi:hypothetical protein
LILKLLSTALRTRQYRIPEQNSIWFLCFCARIKYARSGRQAASKLTDKVARLSINSEAEDLLISEWIARDQARERAVRSPGLYATFFLAAKAVQYPFG